VFAKLLRQHRCVRLCCDALCHSCFEIADVASTGRLNVLANVVRKPLRQIFSEFAGVGPEDDKEYFGTGDVKYHLGTSYDRPTTSGKRVHLSLLANPSHLEVRKLFNYILRTSLSWEVGNW
jgi:hypothetical protein